MTTYTLVNAPAGTVLPWGASSSWAGGVVPNTPDADVVLGSVLPNASATFPDIGAFQGYSIRSLGETGAALTLEGTLVVSGAVNVNPSNFGNGGATSGTIFLNGGTLRAGSLVTNQNAKATVLSGFTNDSIYGTGTISVSGVLTPNGSLVADGGVLTVSAASVNGSYGSSFNGEIGARNGGTLYLSGATPITEFDGSAFSQGANLQLGTHGEAVTGDAVDVFNPATGTYQNILTTLRAIGYYGTVSFAGAQVFTLSNPVIAGNNAHIVVDGSTLSGNSIEIAYASSLIGNGVIDNPLINGSTVAASGGRLVLAGPIYQEPPGHGYGPFQLGTLYTDAATIPVLELATATSQPVSLSAQGVLQLDAPASFTGSITVSPPVVGATVSGSATPAPTNPNQVILEGTTLASVTGVSFVRNGSGGTLTIQEGAARQTLNFIGASLTANSFTLSSGPGTSLDVSVVLPAGALSVNLAGTAGSTVIGNSDTLSLNGGASPGATVSVTANGVAAAVTYGGTAGQGFETYAATLPQGLALGLQRVSVVATGGNGVGAGQATAAFSIDRLPNPVNNITTASQSSGELRQLLNQGYAFNLSPGTQELQLTNGLLSVGTDTNQAVVQRLYEGLLGRGADMGGLIADTNALASGTNVTLVAANILSSPEFMRQPGANFGDINFVASAYQNFLGRAGSTSDIAGFTNALSNGVSRGQVAAVFATSNEAKAHLAFATADIWTPDSVGAVVTQVYQTALNRDPGLAELAAWQQQFAAGLTQPAFAQIVASSVEFGVQHNGQSATAFVTSLYQSGLGRTPGGNEAQGYVAQVQGGAAPAAVLLSIATSAEAYGHISPTI